jgi:uncharacterized Zn finger protein
MPTTRPVLIADCPTCRAPHSAFAPRGRFALECGSCGSVHQVGPIVAVTNEAGREVHWITGAASSVA